MRSWLKRLRAVLRFHDYQPQHVSMTSVAKWMKQLKTKEDQKLAWMLLDKVIYLSEAETKRSFCIRMQLSWRIFVRRP